MGNTRRASTTAGTGDNATDGTTGALAAAPGTTTRLVENDRNEPALRTERADIATATEPGADDKREESTREYHVLRRHDNGAEEYDSADAIERAGATARHRRSTRTMRPSDAANLVRLGVLSESAPDATAAPRPSSMVSGGAALDLGMGGAGGTKAQADQ